MTNNRLTVFSLLLLALLLSLASCKDSRRSHSDDEADEDNVELSDSEVAFDDLRRTVKSVNAECPIDISAMGTLTSIELKGHTLVYTYDLDEDFISIEALAGNKDLMKQNVMAMLSNPDAATRKLLQLVIESGCKMKYVMRGEDSGTTASATLTARELEEAISSDLSPLDKLKAAVSSTNMQMPMQAGEGLLITKLEIIGNNVTYICQVDEDLVDVVLLKSHEAEVKRGIVQTIPAMGIAERQFLQMVVNAGKNLAYRYVGDTTGESLTAVVGNEELENLLNN